MGPLNTQLGLPIPLVLGIQPQSAHLLSLLFTTTYVGSLYLAQTVGLPAYLRSRKVKFTSNTPGIKVPPVSASDEPEVGSRDHPATIRIRMRAVGIATGLSLFGIYYVVKQTGNYGWKEAIKPALTLLGLPTALTFTTPNIFSVLPYLLAPSILFGPLVAMYLDRDLPLQRAIPGDDRIISRIKHAWNSWSIVNTRNYVVGPLTEELVFRSTILAASLLGKLSFKSLIFGTPLWFGIAHAHHAWDTYKKNGGDKAAAIQAAITSSFQLTYTTLFGWFASYLFLRTGSIIPPLVSHMFCNYMGIYMPTTAIDRHPSKKISKSPPLMELMIVIWSSYILGIAGFVAGLRIL